MNTELDTRLNNLEMVASIVFGSQTDADKVEDLKEYLRMATPFGECEECGKYHANESEGE